MNVQALQNLTEEDIAFLEEQNSIPGITPVLATLKSGYARNFQRPQLQQFENITRRTLNPGFVLCFHCGEQVLQMLKDLYFGYEAYKAQIEAEDLANIVTETKNWANDPAVLTDLKSRVATEPAAVEPKKNKGGRPKKSANN